MSELLAGSPGVIMQDEWLVVLLVAILCAVIGAIVGWYMSGPR